MTRDPVCGMAVARADAVATSVHRLRTYYFCSLSCKQAFNREPERYLSDTHFGRVGRHEQFGHHHGFCHGEFHHLHHSHQ